MPKFINLVHSKQEASLAGLLLALLVVLVLLTSLALAGTASAAVCEGVPPPGCYLDAKCQVVCPAPAPAEDGSCDYGRNPEALWPDNPDGHPFERAFCDGLTEDKYKHPLDSLENEGLYCDEVPGCWAYGMTQEGHH